jgi:hypothetical protein
MWAISLSVKDIGELFTGVDAGLVLVANGYLLFRLTARNGIRRRRINRSAEDGSRTGQRTLVS